MAQAKALKEGIKITVTSGDYEGHTGYVVDGWVVPDGGGETPSGERVDENNQRKMLVAIEDLHTHDDESFEVYILPRQMEPFTYGRVGSVPEKKVALTNITPGTVMSAEPITDPMDDALDQYRPDPALVKAYVSREVPGGFNDIEYMLAMRDERDARGFSPNVALVGETQSGKTMLINVLAVLAAERDGMPKPYPVFTLSGSSGITNYDLFGMTTAVIINGEEVLVWMEGIVPLASRCGGFLYLDEWNAVTPSQATALHPLMDDRRMFVNTQKATPDGHGGFRPEIVHANPALWILSTINPGYKGTQTMAEATSNRFRWLPWDYDEDTENVLVPSKTVRIIGEALREAREARMVTVPIGTSSLQRLTADCAMFGVDNALWAFIGIFPPAERERVNTIVEDGGFADLLRTEYPSPKFSGLEEPEETPTPGATWDPDALAASKA